MYVCVYIYMHMCLQLCVNTLMCAGIMCVSIHIMYAYTRIHVNVCLCTCDYLRACTKCWGHLGVKF